jgi:hypothetical protein
MKTRKTIAGIIAAALLIGSVTATAAEEITAKLSPQKIYVDGQRVELLAYNISDNNYVRLRDLGKAADFSVFYDASGDSVRIDRGYGYEDGGEVLPTPGGSPAAVPSEQKIYAGEKLVNITLYSIADNNYAKLRDVGGALNLGMAYDPDADAVYIDRQTAYLPNMPPELLRPEAIPDNVEVRQSEPDALKSEENPYFILTGETLIRTAEIEMITTYLSEEYNAVKPIVDELNAMATNREKINAIVRYVCERMTYDHPAEETYTRIEQDSTGHTTHSMRYAMFLDDAPVKGVCFHYSKAVHFLCTLSGVPSELIESYESNHAWNGVYADGEWWYIDATNEDVADEPIPSDTDVLFAMDTPNLPFADDNPESTKERMEQLVPGSTK